MKRFFRKIHLWLSVPFGLIISVTCFSGASLVFENEIMELLRPELYSVKTVQASPLPLYTLLNTVSATLPDGVSITGVTVSSNPERTYQISLSSSRRGSIYIDQYTGEITGKYERAAFFYSMYSLHRWLLDSMKSDGVFFWGKMIVGTSTLMFVFVLISGVVIWWPRTKKALRNSFKITLHKGVRRFWYDLHVVGGLYALLFLLAMALTGLTWSFPWYRTGFYKVFGAEVQQGAGRSHRHGRSEQESSGENKRRNQDSLYIHWQKIYEKLKDRNPEYKLITVSKGSATVAFNRLGNQRATDRYKFNLRTGEISETILYKDTDVSGSLRGWIYSVHVGSWGGMSTRILTFIAAVLGGSLPLTGYDLWLRRLRKKRKKC